MQLGKRLAGSRPFQLAAGFLAAEYLRLVWNTSQMVFDPPGILERAVADAPVILTMWHGQHFLIPFVKPNDLPAKVMISRHRDGEINAIAAERLGIETVRGSGGQGRDSVRKGGAAALREMLAAIREGYSVSMTADVPKVARVAGFGVVSLARMSGRPIYAAAIATRRRIELNSWDRSAVPLPFGSGRVVGFGPIHVAVDADDAALEEARCTVERALNDATARAFRTADGQRGADGRG